MLFCAGTCLSQSLGDVARAERARQAELSQRSGQVYTNDDLASVDVATRSDAPEKGSSPDESTAKAPDHQKESAKELQTKIRAQRAKVKELESRINDIQQRLDARDNIGNVESSQRVLIQGAGMGGPGPGYCAAINAAPSASTKDKEWCAEPAKLHAELDAKTAELKAARSDLEDMQDRARRMGFGVAVYDPD